MDPGDERAARGSGGAGRAGHRRSGCRCGRSLRERRDLRRGSIFADDAEGMERFASPWFDSLATRPAMLRTVGTNQQAILTLYRGMP